MVTKRALGEGAAVVEHPPADLRTPSSRQTTLLNGVPLNSCGVAVGADLPEALVPPERPVVDRAAVRPVRLQAAAPAGRAARSSRRSAAASRMPGHRARPVPRTPSSRSTVASASTVSTEVRTQRDSRNSRIVTVLCRFFAASRRRSSVGVGHVQLVVPLDGARDLEAGRAEQADALPDRPSSGTMTFVASRQLSPGPALRRVGDLVAQEVVRPDRDPRVPGSGCSSSRR